MKRPFFTLRILSLVGMLLLKVFEKSKVPAEEREKLNLLLQQLA